MGCPCSTYPYMKITIDTKWLESLSDFDTETKVAMYEAIFDYMSEKEVVNLPDDTWKLFAMLKPMLDEERNKRIRLVERNRANGSLGGRKAKEKNPKEPKQPNGFLSYLQQDKYKERSERLQKFDKWEETYTPYLYNHLPPLTQKEFDVLCNKYIPEQICDTMLQIENRKDLRKKYVSLYRTLLNWMKTNYGEP